MKLLLAEDDERTAESLRMGLAEQGFVVDVTGRGQEALYLAQTISYSLIILDRGCRGTTVGRSWRPIAVGVDKRPYCCSRLTTRQRIA